MQAISPTGALNTSAAVLHCRVLHCRVLRGRRVGRCGLSAQHATAKGARVAPTRQGRHRTLGRAQQHPSALLTPRRPYSRRCIPYSVAARCGRVTPPVEPVIPPCFAVWKSGATPHEPRAAEANFVPNFFTRENRMLWRGRGQRSTVESRSGLGRSGLAIGGGGGLFPKSTARL